MKLSATKHNLTLIFDNFSDVDGKEPNNFRAIFVANKVANPQRSLLSGRDGRAAFDTFDSGAQLLKYINSTPAYARLGAFVTKGEHGGVLFKSSDEPVAIWTYMTNADLVDLCDDIDEQLAKLRTPPPPPEEIIPVGIYYACFNKAPERYKSTMTQSEVADLLRSNVLAYVFDGATQQAKWAWSAWCNDRVRKTPSGIRPFKVYANIEDGRFFHVVED